MYDVENLINLVSDILDAGNEYRRYNVEVRGSKGLPPDFPLLIPSLDGSTAYRLGEVYERYNRALWMLSDFCKILDIDRERLISAVKSMKRWERSRWRWNCNAFLIGAVLSDEDKARLRDFLKPDGGWSGYYISTGRKMK